MALSKAVEDALNDQLAREFYASYLYLSMSAYCTASSLPGFARWMLLQSKEETGHAMKIFQYLEDRSARVKLGAIDQPPRDFKSALEVAQQVRRHEQKVTQEIDRLYEIAVKEKEYATQIFLEWFLTEQVEEEKNSTQLVEQLEMIGDNKSALLLLDRELGARTTTD